MTNFSSDNPIVQLASSETSPPAPEGFDKTKLILPVSILIAAIMISGSILLARSGQPVNRQGNLKPQEKISIDIKGSPSLGSESASVTIVEFGDFQCPFCARYSQNNKPLFISEYINEGKARFVWKDYAFLGQESQWAAEAARCANDQGKFWEYHDYLYSHQGEENAGDFSKINLKKFALSLGLNAQQFNSCLDSGKYAKLIQEETQYASSIGVNGTPATFINGVLVTDEQGYSVGAAPFSVFKEVIDKELSK